MNSSIHTIQGFEVSLVSLFENPKAFCMLCWISDLFLHAFLVKDSYNRERDFENIAAYSTMDVNE